MVNKGQTPIEAGIMSVLWVKGLSHVMVVKRYDPDGVEQELYEAQ